jgi:cysteinyl-tRNA synthetase
MEKNKTEFLLNILFGVFSICLIVVGAISFVASLLEPSLPTFQSIELILFGVIIYTIVKLIFTVDKLFENSLASTDKFIKENEQGNSPQNPDLIKTSVISISDETTPEQIEEIKKKHPQIAEQLDKLLNGFKDTIGSNSPHAKDIYKMSIQQLQRELEKAVENNEFERAAEIRDLLKKKAT